MITCMRVNVELLKRSYVSDSWSVRGWSHGCQVGDWGLVGHTAKVG